MFFKNDCNESFNATENKYYTSIDGFLIEAVQFEESYFNLIINNNK